jgi:regulatory protein
MTDQFQIVKLKRTRGRTMVDISGLDDDFEISRETVYRHQLVEGIVLTPSQVDLLRGESEQYLCNRRAARLLAMRGHSVGELTDKLKQKGHPTEAIKAVIRKYRAQGVLDDEHFAMSIAERLINDRPCGRPYLIAHIQRKKIDRAIAEKVVAMVLAGYNETDLATTALAKRWSQFSRFQLETARTKAYNYLARRGFGYGAARKAFANLLSDQNEVTED